MKALPYARRLALVFAAGVTLLGAAACGDDDDDRIPPPPAEDAGANNAAPGDTGADADDTADVAADVEPDAPRPEPQNDQERILFIDATETWELPELQGEVHVVRTEGNIPHVFATNEHDLAYVLGFVVARDRFFIMDLQRRLAQGTISELLGDLALPNDAESRLMGMAEVSRLIRDGLSEAEGAYFDAYAAGVNEYIRRVNAREVPPPSELMLAGSLLGSNNPADLMRPFTRDDIAAMVAVIVYQTNFDGSDPARAGRAARLDGLFAGAPEEALRRAGARQDLWERLDPIYPYASAPGLGSYEGGEEAGESKSGRRPVAPERPTSAVRPVEGGMLARAQARLEGVKRRLGKHEAENFGSNTWAVSGARTADGAGLVAGDGHLPLYVPSIMYQAGLDTALFAPQGEAGYHHTGLLITSLPLMAVGTNGKIAWSQVNPVSDITDWYREELQLDADGLPASSLFQGEQRTLQRHDETYVIADVPLLDSVGRTETLPRWTTFDGRHIYEIEGRPWVEGDALAQGEAVVHLPSGPVVPGDVDGDGVVTAISFDYTAFDITHYVSALVGFTRAETVQEYQESTRGLIGNMLYSAVADDQGNILFSAYQAVPCRTYLPRDEDGRWMPDADPTGLIDGTRYGGFAIPSLPSGHVDESQGEADPYRCAVPFDKTPQAINPPEGYVLNANNQPAPLMNSGSLEDDAYYLGGPWAEFRADSIRQGLEASVADNQADLDDMADVQAITRSRLGELFVPTLVETLQRASTYRQLDRLLLPHEQRVADLYDANAERFDQVAARLAAWREAGYAAPTGVDTFYHTTTPQELEDSVATMIFNAWLPRALQGTFGDEDMDAAWRYSDGRLPVRALYRFLQGRGPENPADLASWSEATGEPVFFDVLGTEEVERADEVLLLALAAALDFLTAPPTDDAEGGFGTADMSAWRWGLRHQVRFESVLADFLPADSSFGVLADMFAITTRKLPLASPLEAGDPRRDLKWFPRPGDNYSVDAASPGFSGTRFTYGSGPAMRMVISVKDGQVSGRNIIPGGQSGLTTSPFFADQAQLWLGNQTLPMRYHVPDIEAGATGREHYKPAGE